MQDQSMHHESLPRSVDQISSEWLTAALRQRTPGITVESFDIVEIIYGTTTKLRILAHYAGGAKEGFPPSALCIKGGFDERLRKFDFLPVLYQSEGNFFRHLAPQLKIPLMRCWYADAEEGQGIVIFDDLTAAGASFPRPVKEWSIEMVQSALETLAKLHAQTWNIRPSDYPWLRHASDQLRVTAKGCLEDNVWQAMLQRPDARFLPAEQRDRQRMMNALQKIAEASEQEPHCVAHFDATINNSYIEAGSSDPRFCDWQCACIGPFMLDVPYHITGALSVENRRRHEKDLFAYYLHALSENGGPSYSVEEKWLDYRRYQMGMGWMWCTCSLLMQPAETVAVMTERHATAVADHETLQALGV